MKHLFKAWKDLEPLVSECGVFLFLDYDGTLAEIKDHPRLAKFPSGTRKKIRALSKMKGISIGIISGRELSNVRRMTGIGSLIYAGNHGFEIKGPQINWTHAAAGRYVQRLKNVCRKLKSQLKPFPGVWVENKKFSLSIHYRKADPKKLSLVKRVFNKAASSFLRSSGLALTRGKKVWEIRPPAEWDKGSAVNRVIRHCYGRSSAAVLPIFIGDDLSDESAFRVVRRRGIAVKVTRSPNEKSFAKYYLRSPSEVAEFLDFLSEARKRSEKYAGAGAD